METQTKTYLTIENFDHTEPRFRKYLDSLQGEKIIEFKFSDNTPQRILEILTNPKIDELCFESIFQNTQQGKQRMSTLFDFYQNKFALIVENKHYYYKDLDESVQRVIRLFSFTCDIVYEYNDALISDENKIKWFELINFSGTPQDKQHLIDLKS